MDDGDCHSIAERTDSGREAENNVCVAVHLAKHLKEPLALAHLERVINMNHRATPKRKYEDTL